MIRSNGIQIARQVDDYARKLDDKIDEFVSRLAEYGLTIAKAGFPSGYVAVEYRSKEATIYTTNSNAIFIEFGAGFGATHPMAYEFGFDEGSWSREHSRQFWDNQEWTYNGVTYKRIPAQMGMYNASKYMKEVAVRLAREVFE